MELDVKGSGQRRVVTATVDQTDMRGLGTAGLGTVGAASVLGRGSPWGAA